jgi:uncharacterized protein (DUF1697 family)
MVYAALLRGINVGGNNKVDMKQLKLAFEQAGMGSVTTYINSGNIVFTDNHHSKPELSAILEEVIRNAFSLDIKVLVLSLDDYREVMAFLPDAWTNDALMKTDVMFLWDEANEASVLDKLHIKSGIDRVVYAPGAILWSVDKDKVTRSGMTKLVGSKLYKLMTIRNANSTRKIYELMLAVKEA